MNNFNITYYLLEDNTQTEFSSENNIFDLNNSSLEKTIRIKIRNNNSSESYPRFYLTIPTSIPKYKTYVMNSSTEIIDKINNQTISVLLNKKGISDDSNDYSALSFGEINSVAGSTILPNTEKTYEIKVKLINPNVNPFINAFNIEVI